jgi:hypothetical protein
VIGQRFEFVSPTNTTFRKVSALAGNLMAPLIHPLR